MVVPLLPDENSPGNHSEYLENIVYSENLAEDEYYVTAAWDSDTISSVPEEFVVGDETTYMAQPPGQANKVNYTNVPLRPNTNYAIFVRYDIKNENLEGPPDVSACSIEVSC